MKYTKTLVRDVPLSPTRWAELRRIAFNSFYRLNATGADCYSFHVHTAGDRHLDGTISEGDDFSGGWDYIRNIIDDRAQYALMLRDVGGEYFAGRVYKLS